MTIFHALFGKKPSADTRIMGRTIYADHRSVDVPSQILVEVLKATNGYVLKGCVPTDSGPDITEVRIVTDDANLVEEMSALVMSLRMSGGSL